MSRPHIAYVPSMRAIGTWAKSPRVQARSIGVPLSAARIVASDCRCIRLQSPNRRFMR